MNFLRPAPTGILVGAVLISLVSYFALKSTLLSKKMACPQGASTITVNIQAQAFSPSSVSIKRCTKVVFQNTDTALHWPASDLHPTHLIYPEFDPQEPVLAGSSWSFVFDRVGKWRCHDHLNPKVRCVIEVTE